jgi:hypothetical protein
VNEFGNVCIGRKCMVSEATPDGIRFRLDPETCDPATREAFVQAFARGAPRMQWHD